MKSCCIGVKEYYERQFATLKSFEEVDSLEAFECILEDDNNEDEVQQERAIKISNYANVALLILKVQCYIPTLQVNL